MKFIILPSSFPSPKPFKICLFQVPGNHPHFSVKWQHHPHTFPKIQLWSHPSFATSRQKEKQKILTPGWFGEERPPAPAHRRPDRPSSGSGAGAAGGGRGGASAARSAPANAQGSLSSESPGVRKPRTRRNRERPGPLAGAWAAG